MTYVLTGLPNQNEPVFMLFWEDLDKTDGMSKHRSFADFNDLAVDAKRHLVYVADPVCWTEAPEKVTFLRRQRRRWHRGCLETLLIHRRMMLNPRYRAVGLIALPSMLAGDLTSAPASMGAGFGSAVGVRAPTFQPATGPVAFATPS